MTIGVSFVSAARLIYLLQKRVTALLSYSGLEGFLGLMVRFCLLSVMADSVNTEIRAALRDERRVSVAITSIGAAGQGLRVLIGTQTISTDGIEAGASVQAVSAKPREQQAAHLTARELQILRLIAKGLHNRQIAAKIHRSIKTVEKHRQNLHSKLSTHEVAGLTRYALSVGVMDKPQRWTRGLDKSAKRLTPRELEVLKLVAQGSGNKWIASELHRSIKTVDHHRENIMKKLGIHEVAGLTRYAVCLGLM
jgi:DNA-binding NarL/FixJ family response regulator